MPLNRPQYVQNRDETTPEGQERQQSSKQTSNRKTKSLQTHLNLKYQNSNKENVKGLSRGQEVENTTTKELDKREKSSKISKNDSSQLFFKPLDLFPVDALPVSIYHDTKKFSFPHL